MAFSSYLHGIEISEEVKGPPSIKRASTSTIGIVGLGLGSNTGKQLLLTSKKDAMQAFGTGGVLYDAAQANANADQSLTRGLEAIYLQSSPLIIGVQVTNVDQIPKAIEDLQKAQNTVGFSPKIIVAPEHSNTAEVRAMMKVTSEKLRAVSVVESHDKNTATELKDDLVISSRTYMVNSKIRMAVLGETWASACTAGLIAKVDAEKGFFQSPSNSAFNGIEAILNPLSWSLSDPNSEANLYNEVGGATIIRNSSGFCLWGSRTPATKSSDVIEIANKFINVRRITDTINDSIQESLLWAIDKGITKNFVQEVVESVNHFLRELKFVGAIIDGLAWVNPDANTPDKIKEGRIEFDWDYTPLYPAEQIKGRSIITDQYLRGIFV